MLKTLSAAVTAAVLSVMATSASAQPAGVTVFAAASLKNSIDEVDAAFTRRSGTPVHAAYAASSTLARQIEQGAPADVFISADPDWMDDAAKHNDIQPASRRDLLTNHLALIAPKTSDVHLKIGRDMPLVQALGGGRLSMAGPDVPAGRYGKAALVSLNVWDAVQGKAVYGDSVRAALVYVSRGEAPLGIVYDTDALIDPQVKIVGLFPDDSHPPIVYPAALTTSAHGPQASAYLAFIRSPEAAAIFRKYGFGVVGR